MSARGWCVLGLLMPTLAWADDDPYRWDAADPATQLAQNREELPAGTGGVFVPSLSGAGDEPVVYFVSGERVLSGPVGQRVALPSGRYTVLVGSLDPSSSEGVPIRVEAGKTTLVPVSWGGLRLDLVDRRGQKTTAPLQIVDVSSGKTVSMSPEMGDEARTRLLKPGLYRIQSPGTVGVDQPDFVTVHVVEGGLAHLRVFVDGRGTIEGGGVVMSDQVSPSAPSGRGGWRRALVLGADGSYSQFRATPGSPDLAFGQGSVFVNAEATYSDDRHVLEMRGIVDEGLSLVQPGSGKPLPLIKGRDTASADVLYTLLLNEGVGLYAGGGAETNLLPTDSVTAEDTTAVFIDAQGNRETVGVEAGESFRIADALAPTSARTGAGARLRLSTARDFELSVRAGVGSRHYWFGGSAIPLDDPDTSAIEHLRPDNLQRVGAEAGAQLTVRLTKFATYTTEALAFEAFQDLGAPDRLILSWDNDLSLGITRAISVHYRANFDQIREITDTPQIEQGVFLRASWNLL